MKQQGTIHYAWLVCFSATLAVFCTAGLVTTAFSVYQPYLADSLQLTNTQSALIVLIRNIMNASALFTLPFFVKRVPLRILIPSCMLLTAGGFVLYGMAGSFAACCVASAIVGTSNGLGGLATGSILISRWFNEHRGVATGIFTSSTGLSAFIVSPLITLVTEKFSLRTAFLTEAAFIAACCGLVWLVIRSTPQEAGMSPLGETAEAPEHAFAARPMTKADYAKIRLALFTMGITANGFYTFLSLHYKTLSYDSAQIAAIISTFGLLLAGGKIAYGEISDRIGSYRTSWIMFATALSGIALTIAAQNHVFPIAAAGAAAGGFGMSVSNSVAAIYSIEMTTEADYPRVLSGFLFAITMGGLLFNPVMGMLADLFGNYVVPYIVMFIVLLVSAIAIQRIYRRVREKNGPHRE